MASVISDSSTLIHLAKIDQLDLLRKFFGKVTIPPAVWLEVVEEGKGRPGAIGVQTARDAGWIQIQNPTDIRLLQILRSELDQGEAEALTLALEIGASLVLIDESEGRRIATLYNLPKTGVIGVLIRAKREGHLQSLRHELDRLRGEGGFWIAESLYVRAIETVGENVV